MESFRGSRGGALQRRWSRALGAAGASLVFGVGAFGPLPALSAAISWAHMASPPSVAAQTHRVSFTFVPAEPGRGQSSQGDEGGFGSGGEDGDESSDITAYSAPIPMDSGPVVVGAEPPPQRRAMAPSEARMDWHVSNLPDDMQGYAPPQRPEVKAVRKERPALTMTDEQPQDEYAAQEALLSRRGGETQQVNDGFETRGHAKTTRRALTIADEVPQADDAQTAVRPHRPELWQYDADVVPSASGKSRRAVLTVTDEMPQFSADSRSGVRPHRPQDVLVYGDAAESGDARLSHGNMPSVQVLRNSADVSASLSGSVSAPSPALVPAIATPAIPEALPGTQDKFAQALSAKILSDEDSSPHIRTQESTTAAAPPPVLPSATVTRQENATVPMQASSEPVAQEAQMLPSAPAGDTFSEREVVARSERAASMRSSVSQHDRASSLTFPSAYDADADAVVVPAGMRSVSGGGMAPPIPQAAVVSSQNAYGSVPARGIIKASMPVASGAPLATPSFPGNARRIDATSMQVAQLQAAQSPAPVAQAVYAPARPLAAGDAKVYEVTDVAVDVNAESAARARDQALAKAQKTAFGQLIERLGGNPAAADTASAEVLAGLMQSFEVQNERASPSRYLGMFTIQFKPSAVRAWLDQNRVAYSDVKSGPVVVLPVYVNGGKPVLWEDRTRWRTAWENSSRDTGLVPVIVPNGELDDMSAVGTEDAAAGKPDPLKAIAAKYRAAGTAVVTLNGSFDHPAAGFSIQMQRVDAMGNAAAPETVPLPIQEVGRSGSDAMLALSVKKVRQQLEADWRLERSLASVGTATSAVSAVGIKGVAGDEDASQGVVIRLRAIAPVPSGGAWENLRHRMTNIPGLPRVDLLSLQSGAARVELGVSSSIEEVQAALLDRDIELRQDPIGGGWSLHALQ